MPAFGRALRISAVRTAKERPDEPAPWCVTNKGAVPTGEVRYAWWVMARVSVFDSRKISRSKYRVQGIWSSVLLFGDLYKYKHSKEEYEMGTRLTLRAAQIDSGSGRVLWFQLRMRTRQRTPKRSHRQLEVP